jgi:hypothetical protein
MGRIITLPGRMAAARQGEPARSVKAIQAVTRARSISPQGMKRMS